MVFAAKGGIKNGAEGAVPRQRSDTIYLPRARALNPSGRRQPIPDRTLGAQGQRPGGAINPHARKGVSTFGNTGKHRPDPDANPDRAHLQPTNILMYYSLFSCKTLEFMIKYHYVVSTYLNKEMGIV